MLNYQWTGSGVSLYLDAKIREVLSFFLCRNGKDCTHCLSRDKEKLIRAKEIIERLYQNPPSLRELSLMVGTKRMYAEERFQNVVRRHRLRSPIQLPHETCPSIPVRRRQNDTRNSRFGRI
jgi:hypothetical protein